MIAEALKIEEDTSKKVNEASKVLGIEEQELVDRAILIYLDSLDKYITLKKEMKAWDLLSDEALINFERAL